MHAVPSINACMCVSVVYGGICIMRVIVYDETKDAMQDARWCYVPTDRVAAAQIDSSRWLDRSRRLLRCSAGSCRRLSEND